jgi:hypothetical protein
VLVCCGARSWHGLVPCRAAAQGQMPISGPEIHCGAVVPRVRCVALVLFVLPLLSYFVFDWYPYHPLSLNLLLCWFSFPMRSPLSLNSGASGPGGPEFIEYKDRVAAKHGVQFLMSLSELPPNTEKAPRLALISGRTADNPRLLTQAIAVRRIDSISHFSIAPSTHFSFSIRSISFSRFLERLHLHLFRKAWRPHGDGIGVRLQRYLYPRGTGRVL